jgi:nucleoside-diphosphate-sugar epimerase
MPPVPGVKWVQGDLMEPAAWRSLIGPGTIVLHMAAVTGKTTAQEHERVNLRGTELLLKQCRDQGVARFVYVSSIAARYPDLRHYPYGAAKRAAETLVQASGIPFLILRPTIVLGAQSPIWQKLRQLASGRVIPLIGDGTARVQPVHVDDVASVVAAFAMDTRRTGIAEVGGRDVLTMRELLAKIHQLTGSGSPRFVQLPYNMIRMVLRWFERMAPSAVPITEGQLSVFVNDSTTLPELAVHAQFPQMMSIDEMLRACAAERGA